MFNFLWYNMHYLRELFYMDINYEEFRKKHGYVLNPAKSFELSKDFPSIKRKHVKSRRKTFKA